MLTTEDLYSRIEEVKSDLAASNASRCSCAAEDRRALASYLYWLRAKAVKKLGQKAG